MAISLLDTSALVKRYWTEPGTDVVAQLFAGTQPEDRSYISEPVMLELTSAIWRLVKGARIPVDLANAVISSFRADVRQLFLVWELDGGIVEAAVSVAEQFRLRSGDAIHLATALVLSGVQPGARFVMVSADRELLEASSSAGLATLNPEEARASVQLSDIRR